MFHVQHWERGLLEMAHSALDSGIAAHEHASDSAVLEFAYRRSEEITRHNSKTFFMASGLLPWAKRRAARAMYAFCRISDDLVDRPASANGAQELESWRRMVQFGVQGGNLPESAHEVSLAWADARRAYRIPRGYVDQLIDGISLDLRQARYETFADLARYCYGVACTVGLMAMHVTGYSGREAIPYAIRLGVALQLTNILRDVGEDWRSGRLYLPREDLEAFDISEEQISEGVVDHRWRAMMRYQIERARHLYAGALPGVALLNRDGRFAIAASGELYRGILDRIEANDYNVFNRRASLGALGKLSRLPGIWLRSQTARV